MCSVKIFGSYANDCCYTVFVSAMSFSYFTESGVLALLVVSIHCV